MSDLRGFSTRGSGAQRSLAHLPQVDDKLLNHGVGFLGGTFMVYIILY